jgi:hypothetical protein
LLIEKLQTFGVRFCLPILNPQSSINNPKGTAFLEPSGGVIAWTTQHRPAAKQRAKPTQLTGGST